MAKGLPVLALCVLLVGCGEPSLAPPNDASGLLVGATPSSPSSSEPAATPAPSLGEVVWATSGDPATNAPQEPVSAFAPEAPRISAYVLANALPAGSTVQADWEYNDTSLDAFTRQIVVSNPANQTWLSFHIDRGEAATWPVGVYGVTISLNGQLARQASVEVRSPS